MEQEKAQTFRFFIKIFRFWRHFRDRFAASLDVNLDRKVELYIGLLKSATLRDIVYWLQLLFSAGIATLGLVLNSTAVIIGAMLISPLMGPILSAGLALATGDLILAVRSAANLILSSLGAIIFALFLVALLPFKDVTAEIAARTQPNTLDLVIALFSGAIGSIATCREVKGVVTSIPGVAIAVALMPPICVIGFGLGFAVGLDYAEGIEIAKGGGLLYLTNLVAITFTAMIVFFLLRIDTVKVREKVQLWRETDREHVFWRNLISKVPRLEQARKIRSVSLRLLMILLPLLIIFIPLSQSFSKMRQDTLDKQRLTGIEKAAREIWKEKIVERREDSQPGSLDEMIITEENGMTNIYMRVFNKTPFTQTERDRFIEFLADKLNKKASEISLQLIEIPLSEKEKKSPVIETTPTPVTVAQLQTNFLGRVRNILTGINLPGPAALIDYDVILKSNNSSEIRINYLSSRDIEPDGKSLLLEKVRENLNIQNLTLSYTRISSELQPIGFAGNGADLEKETPEVLNIVGEVLKAHPNLRLRIMLEPDEENKELAEARKNKLKEFWMQNHSISEDRFAFAETTDEENADTCQFFIRR
jgi:uncharacterized hydrophobic protein (TIGR00271 family)